MNISIFGLGYVGCVSLGCLSAMGHKMIGVDVNHTKVNLISSGKSTIVEEGIDELIESGVTSGAIVATLDVSEAITKSDIAIICVGTPSQENGHFDMSQIYTVARQIGKEIKNKETFFTVAIRSTVILGTIHRIAEIIELESGKKNIKDFAVVSNPEFLREGTAVSDFHCPPYIVLASESDKAIQIMQRVYKGIKARFIVTEIDVAELIKLLNNTFHALKIVFANEIGRICKVLGIDSHELMSLFVEDKILNISPYYLKPGFSYGGSCLPKDLKALNTIAHDNYVDLPVLSAISKSNKIHIENTLDLILKKNRSNIGLYGIAFKANTDDLRSSPGLELAERLIGKGLKVRIFDKNVALSMLLGKNKEYVYSKLPHIGDILIDKFDIFLDGLDILVIINTDDGISDLLNKNLKGLDIIDLAGVDILKKLENYEGICW